METQGITHIEWGAIGFGLVVTFLTSWLLVWSKRWHGDFTMDSQHGVQKVHSDPTPRVGGVAICLGGLCVWSILQLSNSPTAIETRLLLGFVLLGAIPAFGAGLIEDVTKRVSVKTRLIATILSGLFFAMYTGYFVHDVGLPAVDTLLAFAPVGLLFTAFAVSGIANSVNIIDGFHGLAGGVVLLMLLTLAVIAFRVGDVVILNLALAGAAVVLGFMLLNFPKGLIFLGDAGAYSLGYFVAVLALALTARNPDVVSPWAMVLVCGYPIIETLFSIYRRMTGKQRRSPGSPDASHLHSLVYRHVVSTRLMPKAPAWKRNAMTSPILWGYAVVPMFGAVFWPESLNMMVAWLLFSFVVYLRAYRQIDHLYAYIRQSSNKV